MNRDEILYEYEQLLLDKKNSIDSEMFCYNAKGNELVATEIFKYAIEKILHWTPQEAYKLLDANIIEILKLRQFVKYISFPPEFDPKFDFYYIVARIYPKTIKVNIKERTLIIYERILSGDIGPGGRVATRFPQHFFDGRDGEMRAIFCLKYAIQNYGSFKNINDMYRIFAGPEGREFLRKVKLNQACEVLFDFPIDYFHSVFSESQQKANEFIYTMYRFKAYEDNIEREKQRAIAKEKARIRKEEKERLAKEKAEQEARDTQNAKEEISSSDSTKDENVITENNS